MARRLCPERRQPRLGCFLVGHDGSPASSRALAEAAWRARAQHGCVTVVLSAPRAPRWAVFSPTSMLMLDYDTRTEAVRELARAVDSLPDRVSVTMVETRRALGPALLEHWRRGEHDAVVLSSGPAFGSTRVAARLLRRAGADPILIGARPRRRRPRLRLPLGRRARSRAARRARPA